MSEDYKWRPIEDLPDDWKTLSNGELDSLLQVWRDQKEQLKNTGAARKFIGRLHREWAIETGVIEQVYALDRHESVR